MIATAIMDLCSYIRGYYWAVKGLNYALLGRWVLSWKDFKFTHQTIIQAPIQKGETAVGWLLHYFTGIVWSYLLLLLFPRWLDQLQVWPTVLIALVTLAFPFLIMQPAFGFGFFASKTAQAKQAIKNSVIAHLFFAVGLYVAAWLVHALL